MFGYYIRLALLSIRRNAILSGLMVAAIAVGIGASMTTITVNYAMGSDPIPHKSDTLFAVQVDNWDPNNPCETQCGSVILRRNCNNPAPLNGGQTCSGAAITYGSCPYGTEVCPASNIFGL